MMSTPVGSGRKVAQLRNDVDDIYDILGVIRATVDEHSATLLQHSEILDQHTAILTEHSAKFDRVLEILEVLQAR